MPLKAQTAPPLCILQQGALSSARSAGTPQWQRTRVRLPSLRLLECQRISLPALKVAVVVLLVGQQGRGG